MYSTSSRTHRTYSTGGIIAQPSQVEFRSTSLYNSNIRSNAKQKCYSTAPMQVANGTIKTMASSIGGGMLTDDKSTGFIPTKPQRAPGTPKPQPIGDGWDVALLLAILCVGYVVWKYMSVRRSNN